MEEKYLRALAEKAKTAGTSATGKSAFAEVVVEMVDPNHLALELLNYFMPTTQANAGDQLVKRVKRGKYPVWQMVK